MAEDPEWLHGSHVVSGRELEEKFTPDEDDGGAGRRFRLRLRHGVVLALLLLLVAGGIGAAFAIQQGFLVIPQAGSTVQPTSICPTDTVTPLAPPSVKVNVFNATDRKGLAGTVAAELKTRKFAVGTVDNKDANFGGTVAIISGRDGYAAALAVQRQFTNADYFQDSRTDGTVDVVLFPSFQALVPADKAYQGPGLLLCPRETPKESTVAPLPTAS